MNTWFENPNRRLWTWKSPGDRIRNQIDYITINTRFRSSVYNCRSYPGADCDSDHNLVLAKIKVRMKKMEKQQHNKKLAIPMLRTDKALQKQYRVKVKNKYECLRLPEPTTEEEWQAVRDAFVTTAREVLPAKAKSVKQNWITDEILNLMEKRRKSKGVNRCSVPET